jgi:hypothetical protein
MEDLLSWEPLSDSTLQRVCKCESVVYFYFFYLFFSFSPGSIIELSDTDEKKKENNIIHSWKCKNKNTGMK